MKNYYEILEVNEKASSEVIDKVYKMLVKKYHPDLQPNEKKYEAEQKIKLINEAYDVLSDNLKRELYDRELKNNFVDINEYNLLINENIKLKNELNNIKSKINSYTNTNENSYYNSNNYYSDTQQKNFYNSVNNPIYNYTRNTSNKTNHIRDSYKQNNSNYSNYYKPNLKSEILNKLKNLFKTMIAIFLTFVIIFIIFQIPFFKNILFNLNIENGIFLLPIIVLFIFFISKK